MRSAVALAFSLGALFVVTGCHRAHVLVSDGAGHSTLSIDKGKIVAESTDEKGKKSEVNISGDAHVSLHDDDGNGLTFDAGKNGLKLNAKGEDGDTNLETGKSISEAELGLPFYPGSTEVRSSSLSFESPEKKGVVATRETADEPDKVIDFYKSMVKDRSQVTTSDESGEHHELKGKNDAGDEIGIEAKREKGESKTTVSVALVVSKQVHRSK